MTARGPIGRLVRPAIDLILPSFTIPAGGDAPRRQASPSPAAPTRQGAPGTAPRAVPGPSPIPHPVASPSPARGGAACTFSADTDDDVAYYPAGAKWTHVPRPADPGVSFAKWIGLAR
jgi:hypothetical protein